MGKISANSETFTLVAATYTRYFPVPKGKVYLLKSVNIRWYTGSGADNPKIGGCIEYDIDGAGTWRRVANIGKVTLDGTTITEVVVSFPMNPSLKGASGGCQYITQVDEVGLDRMNIPLGFGFRIVLTIEAATAGEHFQSAINIEESSVT